MWTVKKQFKGADIAGFSKPLGEQSQREINNLKPEIREHYFDKSNKRSSKHSQANAEGEGE